MADIIIASTNNGNFTTAATWHLCDATSALGVETGSEELGTSYASSAAFTPGAIEVDGVAIKIASTIASPTGTIKIQLYNSTDSIAVANTEVTINASDIASATAGSIGWVFFKFANPVTLEAAHNYTVQAKESAAADNVVVYRNGTAANYCRLLRVTTDHTPVAGDKMLVLGEWTAAATKTDINVVMDEIATTDYGTASTTIESIGIGKGGTITWGTTASTNYNLRLSGTLVVWLGGTYTMGTGMPSTSTAKLEFDCAADGDFGFIAYGAVNIQGTALTADRCLLNGNEAAGQTVLSVDTNTGWVSGQEIGIASTDATYSHCEKRTVSSSDATTVTVSSSITYAHSGTSPTQAELINLTRNVKITVVTTSAIAYVNFKATATVDVDWTEFSYLGASGVGKQGIVIETTSAGNCNIQRSTLHDFERYGLNFTGTNNNVTFSYNVCYNLCNAANDPVVLSSSMGNCVISNNIFMLAPTNIASFIVASPCTMENNSLIGFYGHALSIETTSAVTITGFNIHSNADVGIYFGFNNSNTGSTISGCTIWRNGDVGILFDDTYAYCMITIDSCLLFGNTKANIQFYSTGAVSDLVVSNTTSRSDSGYATTYGIDINTAGYVALMRIDSCDFSPTTAHTADIRFSSACFAQITAINTVFRSATEVSQQTNLLGTSFVSSAKHDQTVATHKTWMKYGTLSLDAVVYNTATPSLLMTPNNASNKLESAPTDYGMKIAVASGATLSPSVYVRKTETYNGNQPRLLIRKNAAAGIAAGSVLATMTLGTGSWEQLTGATATVTDDATLEFVVDCDGTAGAVNVDDWTVS